MDTNLKNYSIIDREGNEILTDLSYEEYYNIMLEDYGIDIEDQELLEV